MRFFGVFRGSLSSACSVFLRVEADRLRLNPESRCFWGCPTINMVNDDDRSRCHNANGVFCSEEGSEWTVIQNTFPSPFTKKLIALGPALACVASLHFSNIPVQVMNRPAMRHSLRSRLRRTRSGRVCRSHRRPVVRRRRVRSTWPPRSMGWAMRSYPKFRGQFREIRSARL